MEQEGHKPPHEGDADSAEDRWKDFRAHHAPKRRKANPLERSILLLGFATVFGALVFLNWSALVGTLDSAANLILLAFGAPRIGGETEGPRLLLRWLIGGLTVLGVLLGCLIGWDMMREADEE